MNTCTIEDCDKPHRARGMCTMHYKRVRRANGQERPNPWDESRQASADRRRARKAGATIGPAFTRAAVYERDEWICGLCGDPIPRNATYPAPLSVSLDHIIPLSAGGAHTMENTQASHLRCNVAKGARNYSGNATGETVTTAQRRAATQAAALHAARAEAVRARLVAGTLRRLESSRAL